MVVGPHALSRGTARSVAAVASRFRCNPRASPKRRALACGAAIPVGACSARSWPRTGSARAGRVCTRYRRQDGDATTPEA